MTPEDRELIIALVDMNPPSQAQLAKVLTHFNSHDGNDLGLSLLSDAIERRDPIDVELALILGFKFGISMTYLDALLKLARSAWHFRHEDVATALGMLRSPVAIEALRHLAEWVPTYLDFDESRALAVKAVWALGAISTDSSRIALIELTRSESDIVRAAALSQLQR